MTKKTITSKSVTTWCNHLIWSNNKYMMTSLLDEFTGRIVFTCVNPPFVTGAGDTIAATLSVALSNGLDLRENRQKLQMLPQESLSARQAPPPAP